VAVRRQVCLEPTTKPPQPDLPKVHKRKPLDETKGGARVAGVGPSAM